MASERTVEDNHDHVEARIGDEGPENTAIDFGHALADIADHLSGREWEADDFDYIVDILHGQGFVIEGVSEDEEEV